MKIKEKLKQIVLDLTKESVRYPRMKTTDVIYILSNLIEDYFKDEWIEIYKDDDLPKDSYNYWIMQSDGLIQTMKEYEENKKYWIVNATHYQPIIKPNKPII
ncbi:MAG: hypothetical protein ACRC1F_00015 [Metamycoplasmataceae bacterium]